MAMLVITRGYKLYNDSLDSSGARYPGHSGTLGYPGLHLFDLLGEVNQGSREQGGLCTCYPWWLAEDSTGRYWKIIWKSSHLGEKSGKVWKSGRYILGEKSRKGYI